MEVGKPGEGGHFQITTRHIEYEKMNKNRRGGFRAWAGRPGREIKVEDCLRLGVSALGRGGVLSSPWRGNWVWRDDASGRVRALVYLESNAESLNLSFTNMQGNFVRQSIPLRTLPNTFGGYRVFFSCPGCSARRRFLYLRGGLFLCRSCQDLRYQCQSEDEMSRLWRAQEKFEAHLGNGCVRPKGMHLTTFKRLRSKIVDLEKHRDQLMFDAILAHTGIPSSEDHLAMPRTPQSPGVNQ